MPVVRGWIIPGVPRHLPRPPPLHRGWKIHANLVGRGQTTGHGGRGEGRGKAWEGEKKERKKNKTVREVMLDQTSWLQPDYPSCPLIFHLKRKCFWYHKEETIMEENVAKSECCSFLFMITTTKGLFLLFCLVSIRLSSNPRLFGVWSNHCGANNHENQLVINCHFCTLMTICRLFYLFIFFNSQRQQKLFSCTFKE